LKYIEEDRLETLLEPVPDFYEYTRGESSPRLSEKVKTIKSIEKQVGINLTKVFKEKLIFKLFNQYDWNKDKIEEAHENKSIKVIIEDLSKKYGISIPNLKEEK